MKPFLLLGALLLVGCGRDSKESPDEEIKSSEQPLGQAASSTQTPTEQQLTNEKDSMLTIRGTIVFKPQEGGFFGFDADDGKKYLPNGLKEKYRRHGLMVEMTGEINMQMVTFQQYGPVLMVKSVKILDESKAKPKPSDNTM